MSRSSIYYGVPRICLAGRLRLEHRIFDSILRSSVELLLKEAVKGNPL
jgi:hypothetical protein